MTEPRPVPIRDASIRLGQFLKLADLVDTGAEARPLVTEGLVEVNGEVETRRGRQLVPGDVVRVRDREGADVRVAGPDEGPVDDGLPW